MKVKDIIEIEKKYLKIKRACDTGYEAFRSAKRMSKKITINLNDARFIIGTIEVELDKLKEHIDEMEV